MSKKELCRSPWASPPDPIQGFRGLGFRALYWDNGKENGNYSRDYRVYIGAILG